MKGYRKLIACLFGVACATVLCYVGKLTGTEYVTLAGGALGAFLATNYAARKNP